MIQIQRTACDTWTVWRVTSTGVGESRCSDFELVARIIREGDYYSLQYATWVGDTGASTTYHHARYFSTADEAKAAARLPRESMAAS